MPQHVVRSERGSARVRDLPAVVGAAGPVEGAAAHHFPVRRVGTPRVGRPRRCERVVVVVRQAAEVAELVREHALARALRLRRAAAARVRPVVRGCLPRAPRHVPGRRPVRDRVAGGVQDRPVGSARRPEGGGNVLTLFPEHLAELLPRRRLVVARRDVKDVVVAAKGRRATRGRLPLCERGLADVAAARVTGRTNGGGLRPDRAVELTEPVLVQLAGHPVGPERRRVDADPSVRVLEPVAVQRHAAVVLVRRRVVVVHPLVHLSGRDRRPARLRIAERMRPRRLADQERLVREVDENDCRAVLRLGAVRRGVVVRRISVRNTCVVGPRQLALVDPALLVDRLQAWVVSRVARACGRGRCRERHHQREHSDPHDPPEPGMSGPDFHRRLPFPACGRRRSP